MIRSTLVYLSIKCRIYLVVFCSVLPAVILSLVLGYFWAQREVFYAEHDAVTLAETLARHQMYLVESSRVFLSELAFSPAVISMDPDSAGQSLRSALARRGRYSNIGLLNANGIVIASAVPLAGPLDLSDRLHVREALQTGRFSIGALVQGRASPGIVIPLASPVRSATDGPVTGVLAAVLPVQVLDGVLEEFTFEEDTVVLSLDRFGVVTLSQQRTHNGYARAEERYPTERPVDREIWFAVQDVCSGGLFDYPGHIAAYSVSRLEDRDPVFSYTVVLIPESTALAVSRSVRNWTILSQFLAFALLLVIARAVTERAVGRRISAVNRALGRIGDGDLSARTDPILTSGEFSTLGIALDAMADRLRKHEQRRDAADIQLTRSVQEQSVLLRELHHRTKNNMQVIVSLINLQVASYTEQPMVEAFGKLKDRIYSMAAAHEQLSETGDLSNIDIGLYLSDLVRALAVTYDPDGASVDAAVHSEFVQMPIETAISLGIVVNELVTNSFKYAFPDRRRGSISVELTRNTAESSGLILRYRDDGIGLGDQGSRSDNAGLGTLLVTNVVESQLSGTITQVLNTGGFGVDIVFGG